MMSLSSLAAVGIRLGDLNFYIPSSQVRGCSLITGPSSAIPSFSAWLGLPPESQQGMHLHLLVPMSGVETGWQLWGALENVMLPAETIFPLPPLLAHSCHIPMLKALVSNDGFSPLLSWE
ncbi:hypothetical protein [Kluyvera sp. CHPC 1.251]|uniref:hypothetical protein n=1 Tax=Kluyvera sp. CHPC 1.251 TaxID=2995175 RepID=UPI002FD84052